MEDRKQEDKTQKTGIREVRKLGRQEQERQEADKTEGRKTGSFEEQEAGKTGSREDKQTI
jgi:hypothetical protein